jgi:hypothetical protein
VRGLFLLVLWMCLKKAALRQAQDGFLQTLLLWNPLGDRYRARTAPFGRRRGMTGHPHSRDRGLPGKFLQQPANHDRQELSRHHLEGRQYAVVEGMQSSASRGGCDVFKLWPPGKLPYPLIQLALSNGNNCTLVTITYDAAIFR